MNLPLLGLLSPGAIAPVLPEKRRASRSGSLLTGSPVLDAIQALSSQHRQSLVDARALGLAAIRAQQQAEERHSSSFSSQAGRSSSGGSSGSEDHTPGVTRAVSAPSATTPSSAASRGGVQLFSAPRQYSLPGSDELQTLGKNPSSLCHTLLFSKVSIACSHVQLQVASMIVCHSFSLCLSLCV
jgi:hypothetical protein